MKEKVDKEQEKLIIDIWEVRINNLHKGYFDSYNEAKSFVDKIEGKFNEIGQINRIIR